MSHTDDLFALAQSDDGPALVAALPADVSPSRIRNADGVSLPLFCLYNGCQRALDGLLSHSDDLTLHEAAALGRNERLTALLQVGTWAIDTLSPDGWTALHLAAFFGYEPAIRQLLAAGADAGLWARGFEHNLPLHAACAGGGANQNAAIALIGASSDIDAKQGGGWSALMLAAGNGVRETVEALLAAGADGTTMNDQGQNAADVAKARGHDAVAAVLDEWRRVAPKMSKL